MPPNELDGRADELANEPSFTDALTDDFEAGKHGGRVHSRHSPEHTRHMLAHAIGVFSDADGTLLPTGATAIAPEDQERIRALNESGADVYLVTGKPQTEIEAVLARCEGLPLKVMYEKGAYEWHADALPDKRKVYLLSSPEVEQRISVLKEECYATWVPEIEQTFPGVTVIPAGSGKYKYGSHQSVLSIDIVDMQKLAQQRAKEETPPDEHPMERDAIKEFDGDRLLAVEGLLNLLLEDHNAGVDDTAKRLQCVHLGNANFEITVGQIDKHLAVRRTKVYERFQAARRNPSIPTDQKPTLLVMGDTGNDAALLGMNAEEGIVAGVVRHKPTPARLVEQADIGVAGSTQGGRILQEMIEAKGLHANLIFVSRTPPTDENGNARIGLPIVLDEGIRRTPNARLICIADDATIAAANRLESRRGKFVNVTLTPEEDFAHYVEISNEVLWPLAHKPHSPAPVEQKSQEKWDIYRGVCRKMAEKVRDELLAAAEREDGKPNVVWVHDYQMIFVAEELKNMDVPVPYSIGIFYHIPVPDADTFIGHLGEARAAEIIDAFGCYDQIGYHTEQYEANHRAICEALGRKPTNTKVKPISVDVAGVREQARKAETHNFQTPELRQIMQGTRRYVQIIMAGVERADLTKKTVQRMRAWLILAKQKPDLFRGRKILEVVKPSRDKIECYKIAWEEVLVLYKEFNAILRDAIGEEDVMVLGDKINHRDDLLSFMARVDALVVTADPDGFNMVIAEGASALLERLDDLMRLLATDRTGMLMSLKEHGFQGAIPTVEGEEITPEAIAASLEKVLLGTLPAPNREQLAAYLEINTIQDWMRTLVNELRIIAVTKQRQNDVAPLPN